MIQNLADLQPVILIALLCAMYGIESIRPYLANPGNKRQHDFQNLIMIAINFVINGAIGTGVVFVVHYTAANHLGLLNLTDFPSVVEIVAGLLLLDFGGYCLHNLQHKVPFLWRFHRVHHADLSVNSTTSLRFHPIETVLVQGIYFSVAVPIFGISVTSFVLYGTLNLMLIILQHSNVRFPYWLEKFGRYVLATPGWHKIHHSNEQKFTDSHYGDLFTFWDRIFGTWHKVSPEEIQYGLKEFADSERQKAVFLLRSPFLDVKSH